MTKQHVNDTNRSPFDEAIAAMRDEPVPDEAPAGAEQRRRRLLVTLTRFGTEQLARKQRQRSLYRWTALAAALFGALIVGVALSRLVAPLEERADGTAKLRTVSGPVQIVRSQGSEEPASASSWLEERDALRTGERGGASLVLASGASVSVGSGAKVRFDRRIDGETVVLDHGRVQLAVPRLVGGSSLAVQTPDALVVVHGTQFSVDVAGKDDAVVTTVDVSVGRVSVERDGALVILGPGGHWTSARPFPDVRREPPARPAEAPLADGEKSTAQAAPSGTVNPDGRLADENRLFRAALTARREGDLRRARGLVSELLRRYPTSPLANAAARERDELDRALESGE